MMCMKDEVQVLRSTSLFAGMHLQKLRMLAFTSERMRFAPGDMMVRKGDVDDFAYVVICGDARIEPETGGHDGEVRHIGVGDVVGEAALLCRRPRQSSVRAVNSVEALRIGRDAYMRLVSQCPQSTANTIRILGERMSQTAF